MVTSTRCLLLMIFVATLLLPSAVSHPVPVHAAEQANTPELKPLPGSCGGGLPTGNDPNLVCCISGYVLLDDQVVAGAVVTVRTVSNNPNEIRHSVTVVTRDNHDGYLPYYQINLSKDLAATPNTLIDIEVTYSTHHRLISSYQVSAGNQQVDAVLPIRTDLNQDYRFVSQLISPGANSEIYRPQGVVADGLGNVYVLDPQSHRVQVFDAAGHFLRTWGTIGNGPGTFFTPSGIAIDSQRRMYIADGNRVQQLDSTGQSLATWGEDGSTRPNSFRTARAVAVDINDNLYVLDSSEGDTPSVRKRTPAGIWSIVYATSYGSGPSQLKAARGIAVSNDGTMYISDAGNHKILVVDANGTYRTFWGTSNGQPGIGGAEFNQPNGVAVDPQGFVYVADSQNNRVQKLTSTGVFVQQWGETSVAGSDTNHFIVPVALSIGSNGSIYVADYYNNRILIIGAGSISSLTSLGSAAPTQLIGPQGVALDEQQSLLYMVNTGVGTLLRSRLTGDGAIASTQKVDIVGSTQFAIPRDVAIDTDGNIYVTDAGYLHDRVVKLDSNGDFMQEWDAGNSGIGSLNDPYGIAVDTSVTPNTIYVADNGNNRVVKFTNDGQVLWEYKGPSITQGQPGITDIAVDSAGSGVLYATANSLGYVIKISADGSKLGEIHHTTITNAANGVAVDSQGSLYVASGSGDHQISKFSPSGAFVSVWGAYGSGDGELNGPFGIAVNHLGQVYVADSSNNRIQVFQPTTRNQSFLATIVHISAASDSGQVTVIGHGMSKIAPEPAFQYDWMLDGKTIDGIDKPSFSFIPPPGSHTLRLRVRNGANVSDWVAKNFTAVEPQSEADWTMMLYLAGDNSGTERLATLVDELKAAIKDERNNVKVVILYDGPGNDDSSFYWQDGDLLRQELLTTANEVNMGDPQTLIDFVGRAHRVAPAKHYYLAIADHGNGLDGTALDITASRDFLSVGELRGALAQIRDELGQPIDILHLDSCLMGLIENAYQVRDSVHYLIASENIAWSAFNYVVYRQTLLGDAAASVRSPLDGSVQIARLYGDAVSGYPYTISVLDLGNITPTVNSLAKLVSELQRSLQQSGNNRALLTNARSASQKFDSDVNYRLDSKDNYIDLSDWAEKIASISSAFEVKEAAEELRSTLTGPNGLIVQSFASSGFIQPTINLANAHGVAIYYPESLEDPTVQRYTRSNTEFAQVTQWASFLDISLAPLSNSPPSEPMLVEPQSYIPRTFVFLPNIRR